MLYFRRRTAARRGQHQRQEQLLRGVCSRRWSSWWRRGNHSHSQVWINCNRLSNSWLSHIWLSSRRWRRLGTIRFDRGYVRRHCRGSRCDRSGGHFRRHRRERRRLCGDRRLRKLRDSRGNVGGHVWGWRDGRKGSHSGWGVCWRVSGCGGFGWRIGGHRGCRSCCTGCGGIICHQRRSWHWCVNSDGRAFGRLRYGGYLDRCQGWGRGQHRWCVRLRT